ncbi:MAG: RNA methyltransferase [Planctomycetota bacterium]
MAEQTWTLIESVANPRVKKTLKLRQSRERRASGLLLAEGRREVERAFAAGLVCRELWVCDALLGGDFQPEGVTERVFAASDKVLRKLAWHDDPEGVLGVFVAPRWTLASLPATRASDTYLVAVGTEKPGNLGAMVRTAAAAGCGAVLAVCPSVDVFNPAAIRNSTGAVFSLPVVAVSDTAVALDWLMQRGIAVVASVAPGQGGGSCFEVSWDFPAAVVVGPEHAGLDAAWREHAAALVTIPMAVSNAKRDVSDATSTERRPVDSLNAATAAAVLLYEAVRRQGGLGEALPR